MYRDLSLLENLKMDKSHATNQFAEVNLKHSSLYTQICMKENSICTIENFLEKYLPVRVLTQISEVLSKVFSSSGSHELKRLHKYEQMKFKQFNHCILHDDGIPDIMKTITEIKTRMTNSLGKKNKHVEG